MTLEAGATNDFVESYLRVEFITFSFTRLLHRVLLNQQNKCFPTVCNLILFDDKTLCPDDVIHTLHITHSKNNSGKEMRLVEDSILEPFAW